MAEKLKRLTEATRRLDLNVSLSNRTKIFQVLYNMLWDLVKVYDQFSIHSQRLCKIFSVESFCVLMYVLLIRSLTQMCCIDKNVDFLQLSHVQAVSFVPFIEARECFKWLKKRKIGGKNTPLNLSKAYGADIKVLKIAITNSCSFCVIFVHPNLIDVIEKLFYITNSYPKIITCRNFEVHRGRKIYSFCDLTSFARTYRRVGYISQRM